MHLFGKSFMVLCVAAAAVSMAIGQPPGGGQPPGSKGGFGGKGKGGKGNDYISLLNNGSVKDELKVTDQQLEKLPAALQSALTEVLSDKQLQRLREIFLQQRGNNAFLDADVKKELKITPEQAKQIQAVVETQAKEQSEMFQGGGFDPDKMQQLQEFTMGKIRGVLTPEQKTAWNKMVGQPFELMVGPGFGGGGFGPKKDNDK